MINTSAEYKKTILKNRVLHHETKIEFADGTVITAQDMHLRFPIIHQIQIVLTSERLLQNS